jgi:flagellar hook protein FlgE
MPFDIGLSGLRASSTDLEVTGNNIANASTVGFKRSRAEFGDVYASGLLGGGSNQAGSGVLVTDIAQQFDQGNISFTDNSLDLAINGGGFYILSDAGATTYTRAGYFGLDNQGFIVSNNNSRLQGFPAANGVISSGTLDDLQISTGDLPPSETTLASIKFNLDSRDDAPDPLIDPFDISNSNSYNSSTSLTIYDSLGNPHVASSYFVKDNVTPNQWAMYTYIDGTDAMTPAGSSFTLTFDSAGSLVSSPILPINWTVTPATGASDMAFTMDIAGSNQFGAEFSVSDVDQDGYAPGRLAGIDVDDQGIIFSRYTNGESLVLGQLALASFDNEQGLTPLGDTVWGESFQSGQPAVGAPQSGALGTIQSGALEESNVDLSEELVRLIIAQRNYQANAKTIETADTVTQALLNIA